MASIATISLFNLALDLSTDWKMLGRYLKLHQEVSSICADYEEVAEQAYRMLQLWRGKNGTQATYQALGKALKQVPRNDLVEDYCIGKNKDFLDQGKRLVSFQSLLCSAHNNKSSNTSREIRFLRRDFIQGKSSFVGS